MYLLLVTIICINTLYWGEIDILILSFPNIQDHFNISTFKTELLLSVNLLAHCFTSLAVGSLLDFLDKRKVILLSLSLYIVGSMICAFCQSFNLLIIGRILQGAGISGPVILCNVIISDNFSIIKQQQVLGLITGASTIVLILAPILGSSLNNFFGWRSIFFTLLITGLVTLLLSYLYIPKKNTTAPKQPRQLSYLELLRSKKIILYILTINFFILPYWIFLALAPILYTKGFNVSLTSFGLYQSSMEISFALISFIFTTLIKNFSTKACLSISNSSSLCFVLIIIYISKYELYNPLLIIVAIHVLTVSTVFTYNILTPLSLEILPDSKGKVSALSIFMKLTLQAVSTQIVSHYYQGNFKPIAISMIISLTLAYYFYYLLLRENKIDGMNESK